MFKYLSGIQKVLLNADFEIKNTTESVIEHGSLKIIKKLHKKKNLCKYAAKFGNLHILEWLKKIDKCPWDKDIPMYAAHYKHFHILEWIRHPNRYKDIGTKCPWDYNTCLTAIYNNDLKMLKWLRGYERDNDIDFGICPTNYNNYKLAHTWGYSDITDWLYKHDNDIWFISCYQPLF